MATFAEQLSAARKAAGMTQEELAAAVHVARNTISNLEHGRTEPDLETLRQLGQLLHVDFMSGEAAPRTDGVPAPAPEAPSDQRTRLSRRGTKRLIAIVCAALVLLAAVLGVFLHQKAKTAEIIVTAEQDPVQMVADPDFWGGMGWYYCFIIRNSSDVAFTPEQAILIFHDDDESVVTSATLGFDVLRGFMYGDEITKGDPDAVYFRDGANYPKGTHVHFILQGTDANGHALESSAVISLSQEQPPEE